MSFVNIYRIYHPEHDLEHSNYSSKFLCAPLWSILLGFQSCPMKAITFWFLSLQSSPVLEFPMNGIIRYVLPPVWLIPPQENVLSCFFSLRKMDISHFFLVMEWSSTEWIYHTCLFLDWWRFRLFPTTNKTSVYMFFYGSLNRLLVSFL